MENNLNLHFPTVNFGPENPNHHYSYNLSTLARSTSNIMSYPSNDLVNSINFTKSPMIDLDMKASSLDHVFGSNKSCGISRSSEMKDKAASSPIQREKLDSSSSNQRKRTRANADQLSILEEAFSHNSSPNSRAREILAEKVNMSERSVQIWFQNRRAKVKLMQKRNYMLQEEAMKHQMYNNNYLNNMSYHSSPFNVHYNNGFSIMNNNHIDPFVTASQALDNPNLSYPATFNGKATIQPRSLSLGSISSPFLGSVNKQNHPNSIMGEIRCDVLSIGSWRRRTVQKGDLQCIYNLSQRVLTWHIADGGMKFKMEIPFSAIVSITIKPIDDGYNQANAIFDTNQVPSFFMEANVQGQLMWAPCNDFTENMQATRFFKHTLYGPLNLLMEDMVALTSKDINLRNMAKLPEDLMKFSMKKEGDNTEEIAQIDFNSEEHFQELFQTNNLNSYSPLS